MRFTVAVRTRWIQSSHRKHEAGEAAFPTEILPTNKMRLEKREPGGRGRLGIRCCLLQYIVGLEK